LRAIFFLLFAGVGLFFPFLNVYYREIGLSGTQIGLISTVGPVVGIFGATVWGLLSDRFGRSRWVIALVGVGVIGSVLVLGEVHTFAGILAVATVYSFFSSAIFPLVDSITLSRLGAQSARYGQYRVWGSIGFIVAASSAGFFFQQAGLNKMFAGYAIIMGFFLLVMLSLPLKALKFQGSVLTGVGQMIRRSSWIVFAVCVFFTWIGYIGMLNFIGVALKALGGSESLIGLVNTIAAIAEIPVMLYSAQLLRKVGAARLIIFGAGFFALRLFLYSLIPAPEWAMAISLLNGLSYGFLWIGVVAYANDLAPANLKATAQSLTAAISSLASLTGGITGGWLFDQVGPLHLFQVLAAFCLIGLISFVGGRFFMARSRHGVTGS